MNYKETIDFLFSQLPMYQKQGKSAFKKNLDNINALSSALGNPEKLFDSIHIAGTNGKGSTAHCLAAIFQQHNYKTAIYTSPHYRDFRERIKIDGNYIPKKSVCAFVHKHMELIKDVQPSFFEITVAMAFDYFAKEEVDIAIIETGLGGRLDSTNIISPKLSIITNISYDHMDMLGDTLEKIASEKAGIIKYKTPIIIGEKQSQTTAVFKEKARRENSKIYFAQNLIKFENTKSKEQLSINHENYHHIITPDLKGTYQVKNIRTSLAASIVWNKHYPDKRLDFGKTILALEKVKAKTRFIGRFEYINYDPKIIVDSAHNEAGILELLKAISEIEFKKLHIILSFVKNKPLDHILSLLPKNASYYFAKAKVPRGLDKDLLSAQAGQFDLKGRSYVSMKNALKAAKRKYQKGDLILVTGSIFGIAEVI